MSCGIALARRMTGWNLHNGPGQAPREPLARRRNGGPVCRCAGRVRLSPSTLVLATRRLITTMGAAQLHLLIIQREDLIDEVAETKRWVDGSN